jgi:cyclophilin family peptidyl-prolyl cis-trans isomerase
MTGKLTFVRSQAMAGWPLALVAAVSVLTLDAACRAQLVPERACVTLNKPLWIGVRVPEPDEPPAGMGTRVGADAERPAVRLLLIESPFAEPAPAPIASTDLPAADPGEPVRVDLAEVFPDLWRAAPARVRYVQLEVGGEPVHAPLLLIPMLPPSYAPRVDRAGVPVFLAPASAPEAFSGYWLLPDRDAVVTVASKELRFRLRADAAPRSVMAFRALVDHGFYDDTPVVRIASLRARPEPDILQFGDPTGTGLGGPGTMLDLEDSPLRQGFGVLSFARAADPNSAGSQVVVGLSGEGVRTLQGRYAAFGQLLGVEAGEHLLSLAKTPVDDQGRPREPLLIETARLVDAAPLGGGLEPANDPTSPGPGGAGGR